MLNRTMLTGEDLQDLRVVSESEANLVALCHEMTARSPLPLVMTEGPRHTIGCVSPAFALLLGREGAALEGRTLMGCLLDVGAEQLQPYIDQVYATNVPTALTDQRHEHPVHGLVTWTYTIWPILSPPSGALGLLLEVHDTTAQQRTERAAQETQAINEQLLLAGLKEQTIADQLRSQLAYSSALTRSLGEGVYALSREGRVTYVNPMAAQLLGYAEAELLGQDARTVIHPPPGRMIPAEAHADPFLAVLQTGATYRSDDAEACHKDGRRVPISYTIAPLIDAGSVAGAVVVFRDLSEIRQLEATREEYLSLLSHDLRTPLTAILVYAQLLLRKLGGASNEREAGQVRAIIESSYRMERMITDVIEQSALEAGSMALAAAPVELGRLVEHMVELLPALADRARIQLEVTSAVPMRGDAVRIERVVVNLLTNALKYSGVDTQVVVRVFVLEEQALLTVQDCGVGIDPEELPHVFDKHYRARSAGTIPGTGLGLYSSQLIVAAHGGRMWVESTRGEGSTFTVAFPYGEELATHDE